MAAVRSAGILLYRETADGGLEVLLAHMGGPYWARKDAGAWSLPKGEYLADEEPLAAARREFAEELGRPVPQGPLTDLGELRQPSGKRIWAWAVAGDFDPEAAEFGTFTMEWPPRSGGTGTFPEVDRVAWFGMDEAREKLVRGQVPFLDRLVELCTTDLRPS